MRAPMDGRRRRLDGNIKPEVVYVPIQVASAYDDHSPRKRYREVGSNVKDLLVAANRRADQV